MLLYISFIHRFRKFLVFHDWVVRPGSARVKRDAWVYVLSFRNGKACKIGCTRRTPRRRLQEWRCKDKSKGFKLVYSVRVSEERMFGIGKNAAVDEEEEAIRTRLEAIGLHVGANFAERLCRDRSLFTETLDVIKFTNHRGIYVLQDNAFKTITRSSSWEGRADATCKAKLGSNSCPQLSFALVRTGETNPMTEGTPLQGLRVALVRVIFDLPALFASQVKNWRRQPLAYVEWMTPFGRRDAESGLYLLSKSTRYHRPYGEIIDVSRLVRNWHLIPNFGREKPSAWTSGNVVDLCKTFYFNSYSDFHMFCAFNANIFHCI
ncbi:hypothetical protein D9758_009180 [Tetrapyrgos nigripes]|uniref:Bacteriophage T5 Orf172 DNA-binding domain-containing protein n=1 Tax=Tetrapyrgos nigripes TaxID=182062 RepID=A0A8H5LJZ0_9AGAR|nr:hypothetical protein D9758_009180 [Tetrapyrgos nigripes]